MSLTIPAGDGGYYIVFTVTNYDKTPFDLTGLTAKFKAWLPGQELRVNASCEIVSATAGICRYLLQTTDFPVPGRYTGELEFTGPQSTQPFPVIITESQ